MAEYQLVITVIGQDQTAPAVQGMERMGVGGVAMGNIVAGAMMAAGAAVAGLASSSLTAAADFQNATATFASVAGGALAEAGFTLDDVANKALDMGAKTQFSAAEAQQAMIELAKGGVPVVDVMGQATQATLDLAAAGEVGLGKSAEIVAAQLGVWASEGVTATDVSNTLAQAANASVVGVEELALGLSAVSGVAQVSGMSFQDLNQTMALIAPGFGSASDAGTSLKTFLLGLQGSTGPAREALGDLGLMTFDTAKAMDTLRKNGIQPMGTDAQTLSNQLLAVAGDMGMTMNESSDWITKNFEISKFYDEQTGSLKDMSQVAGLLQGALAGLTEAQQSAALKTIFGTDAFRAAAFIAKAGAEGFNAMGVAMDAAGTAAEQAAIRNATFKFAWDSLLGTLETIQIVIGGALLPMLTSLLNNAIIPAANGVLAFGQAMISANDPMATFMASISGSLPIIMGIGAAILAYIIPAFVGWAAVAIPAAISTAAAMAPILIPILAIGAAVALLTLAWQNNWGGIQEKTAAVISFIQPYFDQLVAWLGTNIPIALQALATFWTSTLLPALTTVGAFIMSTVVPALSQVASWLSVFIPAAIGAAVIAFVAISTGAQAVWASITTAWQNVVTTTTTTWAQVTTAVQTAITIVATIVQAAWNTVVLITSAAWNAIAGIVGPAIAQVVAVLSPGVALIQSVWTAGWTVVQGATTAAWSVIQGAVAAAVAVVQGVIQSVIAFITATWGGAQLAAQAQTTAAWTAIQTLITGAMLAIRMAIATGIAVVQTIMATAWAVVVAAAQNDFGKIPAIISAGWAQIKSIMSAGVGAITAIAGQMAAAALSLGKSIVSGIISGVGSMGSALSDKLKSMAKGALDAAKGALGIKSPSTVMAAQVGVPIVEGIAKGIQSSTPKATAAMADMAGKLVGLVTNATGAFAQLANIGTISQGAVERFSTSMFTVIRMLDVINVATRGGMMSSAMKFNDGATKVFDTIVKGVDAFSKLATLGAVPEAAVQTFSSVMFRMITLLNEIDVATRGGMMSSAMKFSKGAGDIVSIIGAGAEAFTKLANMGPVSVERVQSFGAALLTVIGEISRVAQWYGAVGVAAAATFAEGAGKVVAIIGPAVDGLNKLSTLADPVPGAMAKFATQVWWAVVKIGEVASWIGADAVAAASRFAESAGKVIGLIGSGVDGFKKLAAFTPLPPGITQTFAIAVWWTVTKMAEVAGWIGTQAVTSAGAFADGAGKVIAIIGSAVDAFKKLTTIAPVAPAAWGVLQDSLYQTMSAISQLAANWTSGALSSVAQFADGAGKAVGIIGAAVDGFTKLITLAPVPSSAWLIFQDALYQVMSAIGQLAANWTAEGIAAAAMFADGAGKVVAIVSNSVTAFKSLSDMGPVSQAGMDAFALAINQLMSRLTAIASQFATESITAAGQFADAAGKSVGILKVGVEGLLLVNTFTAVSVEAMTRFGDGVRLAVAKMAELAVEFGVDATAAAMNFAKAAGEATDFLKKGVDGFKKLGELSEVPQAGMALFADGIVLLITTIVHLGTVISTDVLAEANRFSNAVDVVIQVVLGSLKALTDMAASAASVGLFAKMLVESINTMAAALATQATPAAVNIGQNISIGIANGITAGAPAIQNAVFAAVNAALAAARAALGIASPSKVFKDQIGMQMSAGMAEGVLGGMGGVQAAVGQVSSGALTAGTGSATTNNNQRSITIAPGAIVIQGAGQDADAIGKAVVRDLELAIGGRLA